ncbi:MAG: VWA domain-containing protein [Candidatus Omnitrophota bacterium]|nr:VWA domain-containing protein [Candidatus Omnitrophota bacterium]
MHYGDIKYISIFISSAVLIIIFYILVMRRRESLMEKFADKNMLGGITPTVSIARKIWKIVLIASALLLCIFSLARPQWGFEWQEIKRIGLDMLIAVDVSKSMLARDVRPNRLERSKLAIKDLVKKLNGDRVGLVAFAGTAFLQCPLTIDYNGFLLALDDMNTDTIPRPGTSVSGAIKEAMNAFKGPEKKFKVLVLITDGEELEGDAISVANEAAQAGIRIYCIGVGTPEGELIPTIDERGERAYLADKRGQAVKTRLNEELLKRIAVATGGSYVHATQSDFGLILLYDKVISKLEKQELDTKMKKHYKERYQIFLALAIALLLIESLFSERRR